MHGGSRAHDAWCTECLHTNAVCREGHDEKWRITASNVVRWLYYYYHAQRSVGSVSVSRVHTCLSCTTHTHAHTSSTVVVVLRTCVQQTYRHYFRSRAKSKRGGSAVVDYTRAVVRFLRRVMMPSCSFFIFFFFHFNLLLHSFFFFQTSYSRAFPLLRGIFRELPTVAWYYHLDAISLRR